MAETRRSLVAYLVAMAGCAALLVALLDLRHADLRVPFAHGGDAICAQLWAKGVVENGWFLTNPSLGAPNRMEMHDFPLADGLFFLGLRGLAAVLGDYALVLNVYYLATFFLATASALFAMRRLGVARGPAVACSLLYAFLYYHFFRGEAHPFLASYFLVPLAALVCLRLYRDGAILFDGRDGGPARLDLGSRRAIGAMAICALVGSGGIYYAFFTCYLLLAAGLCAAVARRRWHPLGSAWLLIGVVTAAVVANVSPTLIYRLRHGPNPAAVVRFPVLAELWGLRITHLLLPVPGHRVGALAGLRRAYDFAQTTPPWDSDGASLGVVGAAGFLGLLGALILRTRSGMPRLVDGLAALNAAALALATTSGLGAIFSYVVTPLIRCYNRISVFIAFFALTAVALVLARALRAARTGPERAAAYLGVAAVLVVGILDATPRGLAPRHGEIKAAYERDATFIGQIEATLAPGSMVFQLPLLEFPESLAVGKMVGYDHGRAYLHSRSLRWSYGAMKGRHGDAWQKAAVDQPTSAMLRSLALAGFSGVYVDREGYDDRGVAIEADLGRLTGAAAIESGDRRRAFYDLRPFATALRDGLGPDGWAEARRASLDAVTATWLGGFLGRDDGPDGPPGRICGPRGRVRLDNPSDRPRRVELSMDLRDLALAPRRVRIGWPDGAADYPAAGPVRKSLVVPPGGVTILFSLEGAGPFADPKAPTFRVERFAIAEPDPRPAGRMAAEPAGSARR